jgi:AMP-binding enzyme
VGDPRIRAEGSRDKRLPRRRPVNAAAESAYLGPRMLWGASFFAAMIDCRHRIEVIDSAFHFHQSGSVDNAISLVCGTDSPPLLQDTIGGALAHAASAWPDQEAVVCCESGVRLTFAQLDARATEFAQGLLALNLTPGDRIGIWAPNCVEWTITQYAAARAGLILVNINPAYRKHELEFVLNAVACKALVTAANFKSSDYLAMLCELAPELLRDEPGMLAAQKLPHLKLAVCIDAATVAGILAFAEVSSRGREARRRRQHSVHERHDRIAERCDLDAPKYLEQRVFRG